MPDQKEVRIEHDDNIYDIIGKANELLQEQKIPYEFVFDGKEHDGFDILTLKFIL